MSDLIEQLWPAFQAEVSEQLDALELALLQTAGAGEIDLNAVFRYFHTIKGGCAMMGFGNMESIAHACEDLLDPVRKGSQALTEPLIDALLAAIDVLKLQLATAERTRQDPEGQPALLALLRTLLVPSSQAVASPAPVAVADSSGHSVAEPEAGGGAANGAGSTGTLRVDSSTVDGFVNRIGEMVMLRNMMAHAMQSEELVLRHSRVSTLVRDDGTERTFTKAELQEFRSLLNDIEAQREELAQADARLQGTLARLQEDVLALRVVPIALVFNRLPRLVRDLAHGLDRQVHLEISGEEVRIDKGMVDVLSEPMLHLVRNALDHGIESAADRIAAGKPAQARLRVAARQQGNTLLVEVSDDGRGLDHERIRASAISKGLLTAEAAAALTARELHNLIFLPGFSTAAQVTEVSGRGVGMDAVKTRVLKLGGQVEISTEAGQGTVFTLRLPLSAAIQNVILVEAGGRQLAIPERNVTEILSLSASALQSVQGQACCLLRGVTLPLYHLARLLGQPTVAAAASSSLEVVVLTDGVHRIGLIVERVLGRPEVFIRDIHPDLVRLPGVGGASILGDGRVVIIVDCENLFELAVRQAQSLHSLLRVS